MDKIRLSTQSQNLTFLCIYAFLYNIAFLLVNQYKFQLRHNMNSDLLVMKGLIWFPWIMKLMMSSCCIKV